MIGWGAWTGLGGHVLGALGWRLKGAEAREGDRVAARRCSGMRRWSRWQVPTTYPPALMSQCMTALSPRAGCSCRVGAGREAPIRTPGMWEDLVSFEDPLASLASLALRARINVMLRTRRDDILYSRNCHGARSRRIRGPSHTDGHIQIWVLAQAGRAATRPVAFCGRSMLRLDG